MLVIVVAGAYLAAHVAFEALARRYMIVSGTEYLLLGVLLGPQVTGLILASDVGRFSPFMTLALGWIGALIGAQFYMPELIRLPGRLFRVAFTEALLSLVFVAGVMGVGLIYMFDLTLGEVLLPALALGIISTASAPAGIALATRALGRRGSMIDQLQVTAAIDALVSVLSFGVLLSVLHAAPPGTGRPPTATEWVVISLGIGLVGGALFHLFLGRERQTDRLFIGLAGAIILATGSAAYLRLSPLLPTMLIGAVLVNTSANRAMIRDVLFRVERPLYFVLLIFAGAAWEPSTRAWILPVLLFLVARVIGKLGSARLAARLGGNLDELGPQWGRALLGHGGLAVALALNYHLHEGAGLANLVFTAAIASVLLTDLTSARQAQVVVGDFRERRAARIRAALTSKTVADRPPPEEAP
jgi:Kef-type K+ transport system membrane component KefB